MPSTVVLEKKKAQVEALAERIKGSVAGVVVDYKGINVEDDTKLRKELREAGIEYTVVKNSILKRAADAAGLSGMDPVLEGTTAIATSAEDYVASARILQKYADAHDFFNVKSGYLDGEVIELSKIEALANFRQEKFFLQQSATCSMHRLLHLRARFRQLLTRAALRPARAETPRRLLPKQRPQQRKRLQQMLLKQTKQNNHILTFH